MSSPPQCNRWHLLNRSKTVFIFCSRNFFGLQISMDLRRCSRPISEPQLARLGVFTLPLGSQKFFIQTDKKTNRCR
jgi:hypothetical protein